MSRKAFLCLVRRWHRKIALVIALPIAIIVASGILLQLRSKIPLLQPKSSAGSGITPELSFAQVLAAVQKVPEAEVRSWQDIARIDVWPNKSFAKVRCKNNWEVQVDLTSGKILNVAYRWSSIINSLHSGEFFHALAPTYLFLPASILLGVLLISGLLLFLPIKTAKRTHMPSAIPQIAEPPEAF